VYRPALHAAIHAIFVPRKNNNSAVFMRFSTQKWLKKRMNTARGI
jgi:hypothetical protein